ncbi:acyl-CoA synthetase [Marinobacter santoriniensis NKSG1]|uniref:Acyl-CoA synthetase n=1 Tax=Marinobacter santoriniensis NKSG1 TaxID=1288826 RepID=M7D8C9_9GAMM|nr:acyl-CoA synthetase [Marinobacter santoriniensis NKSG1]
MPDEKWGERPHALVNLKPGEQASAEDTHNHLDQFVDSGAINKRTIPETN